MEKLILFDWGNIVESNETGYTLNMAFNDLFRDLGYKGNDSIERIRKYKITSISTMEKLEEAYNEIKDELNLNASYNEFLNKYDYYLNKIDYYKDVRDYEISLKDRCSIGILSNLLIIDKDRLNRQVGLENYDYVFLSYAFSLRKPDIRIYEKVQEKLPFKKENILFIDDNIKNVEAAKAFGWNAEVAKGTELDRIKKICNDFLSR
ncbi:MAG: HAD-IA family hydrolase [Bacilli bacterium]|nr:HAD-IA family hydrolase [Bacilli bacterium]